MRSHWLYMRCRDRPFGRNCVPHVCFSSRPVCHRLELMVSDRIHVRVRSLDSPHVLGTGRVDVCRGSPWWGPDQYGAQLMSSQLTHSYVPAYAYSYSSNRTPGHQLARVVGASPVALLGPFPLGFSRYMMKDSKAGSTKLNSDMDAYWTKKDEPAAGDDGAQAEEPMKTEEEAQKAEA